MTYDPLKHHRRSIRLKGYDYAQPGAYFVTIVTHDRACLFGDIVDDQMRLNQAGQMVEWTWYDLPNHVDNIELDAFVVMPNHVHGIIIIVGAGAGSVGAGSEPAPTPLPEIVRQFKTFSARRVNQWRGMVGQPVWQRNYYEHIIRDETSLQRIREYIATNPNQWAADHENPAASAGSGPS
ncbi:transposase [Chloroflexus sp.]|uniref:transposase n=1 Tax=Chloroflexus sp. TaxID=1904827 RepID=UPI00404B058A